MHGNIKIGDSHIFLCDEFPERGCGLSPESLKNFHAMIHLYVPDVDKAYERAIAAGAQAVMPPQDMFWGDRYGQIVDPFGQRWSIGTHKEDLTPDEIKVRSQDVCKQMAQTK